MNRAELEAMVAALRKLRSPAALAAASHIEVLFFSAQRTLDDFHANTEKVRAGLMRRDTADCAMIGASWYLLTLACGDRRAAPWEKAAREAIRAPD